MVIRMTMFSTTPFERFVLASRKPFSPYISDVNQSHLLVYLNHILNITWPQGRNHSPSLSSRPLPSDAIYAHGFNSLAISRWHACTPIFSDSYIQLLTYLLRNDSTYSLKIQHVHNKPTRVYKKLFKTNRGACLIPLFSASAHSSSIYPATQAGLRDSQLSILVSYQPLRPCPQYLHVNGWINHLTSACRSIHSPSYRRKARTALQFKTKTCSSIHTFLQWFPWLLIVSRKYVKLVRKSTSSAGLDLPSLISSHLQCALRPVTRGRGAVFQSLAFSTKPQSASRTQTPPWTRSMDACSSYSVLNSTDTVQVSLEGHPPWFHHML